MVQVMDNRKHLSFWCCEKTGIYLNRETGKISFEDKEMYNLIINGKDIMEEENNKIQNSLTRHLITWSVFIILVIAIIVVAINTLNTF